MQNYLIISSDTHAAPPLAEYREYLDPSFRDDFDTWAKQYVSFRKTFTTMRAEAAAKGEVEPAIVEIFRGDEEKRAGVVGAWDMKIRLKEREREGVAGEVIFPDTQNDNVVPFDAFGAYDANSKSAEHRFAGARAYNRWLAEFCSDDPVGMFGLAVVPTTDIEAMVAEVRRARSEGLRGVIIDTPTDESRMYCHSRFDPLWAACEELAMPLHHHHGTSPDFGDSPGAQQALFGFEMHFWWRRALSLMILGGVFDRFPGLRLAFTEGGADWVPAVLHRLGQRPADSGMGDPWGHLKRAPLDYWRDNCAVGASFATQAEVRKYEEIGVDNFMWGSDFPHFEGVWPESWMEITEAFAGVPDDDLRKMLGLNAARFYGFDIDALQPFVEEHGPPPGSFVGGEVRDCPYTDLDYAYGQVFVKEIFQRAIKRLAKAQ